MSEEVEETTAPETDKGVEFTLALVKLLEQAKDSLPAPKRAPDLALPNRQVLYKMLAGKIVNGYQVEFAMLSGDIYYGFVVGLDESVIQIISTGYGDQFRRLGRIGEYKLNHYELTSQDIVRHWLPISNIDAYSENYFGVKHLTKAGKDLVNDERKTMIKVAERWLNPYARK